MAALDLGKQLDDLLVDVQMASASSSNVKNIVEFINTEIDKEAWGIELSINQWAVIKAFHQLPLTEEEQSFLESLKHSEFSRTTWESYQEISYQYLVLEVGRRGSKCLCIDSIILTDVGYRYLYEILGYSMPNNTSNILTAKGSFSLEAVQKDLKLGSSTSINEVVAIEGQNATANASTFYVKGLSKTKIVKTDCAFNIEATPEHRIKVLDQNGNIVWRYFSDIKKDEYACLHRSTNLFPTKYVDCSAYIPMETHYANGHKTPKHAYPLEITPNVAELLGLLVADGSWTKTNVIELTLHEQDLPYYKQVLADNFLIDDVQQSFDRRSNHGYRLTIYSTILRTFFDRLGFSTVSTPKTKAIPWVIRQSPKDAQIKFLSALFAADGCCGKGGRDVSLSTASLILAQEVQLMLLNFGIVSKIDTRLINNVEYYIVILRGQRSLKLFAKDITFALTRKQELLTTYLAKSSKDGGDTERIPNQTKWLQRIRESLPTNLGKQPGSRLGRWGNKLSQEVLEKKPLRNLRAEFRAIAGNAIKEGSTENLSSYRLQAIIDFAKEFSNDLEAIQHFEYLKECDYFYDQIESVEDSEAFCVDLTVPGSEQYVAQGFTNHNSSSCAVLVVYEFYRLCHIPNPQKYYGIGSNTPITILILATSADQAKGTIFAQICGMMRFVKYFQPFINKKLIVIGVEEISYKNKLLEIRSGNSKSSSQVGYSIILLVMDEMNRIEGTIEGDEAILASLSMWDNLGASGISFGKDAKRIALSSAWFEGDATEQLYKLAEVNPIYLGFRLCTWQLNPKFNRDNPIIASAYISNPKLAALDHEGIRSGLTSSFFDSTEVVNCFKGSSSIYVNTRSDKETNFLEIESVEKFYGTSYGYLDPAVKTDSYAFAYGHKELIDNKNFVFIDGILVWKPYNKNKVSIVHVQECIKEVHKYRNITELGTDHHNSAETAERLTAEGIPVQEYPASNKIQIAQYSCARELMHEGRLILPKSGRWRNLAQDELCKVVMIKNTKIDHLPGFSKDVSDVICGTTWLLLNKPNYNTFNPTVLGDSTKVPNEVRVLSTTQSLVPFSRDSYKNLFSNRYRR